MVAAKSYLTAVSNLGEYLIRSEEAQAGEGARHLEMVQQIKDRVHAGVLQAAEEQALDSRRRVWRILSIGTSFTWDELVLVITLRTELERFSSVMALFEMEPTALDLADLDFEIRQVARSSANRSTFASALRTVVKNSGIEIEDRWTG
jgi:hypothetical protein